MEARKGLDVNYGHENVNLKIIKVIPQQHYTHPHMYLYVLGAMSFDFLNNIKLRYLVQIQFQL